MWTEDEMARYSRKESLRPRSARLKRNRSTSQEMEGWLQRPNTLIELQMPVIIMIMSSL